MEIDSLIEPQPGTAHMRPELSGWKIGFAAGISLALTLLGLSLLLWIGKGLLDAVHDSQLRSEADQQAKADQVVSAEFRAHAAAVAEAMRNERTAVFKGAQANKEADSDAEKKVNDLQSSARTAHERQIADALWATQLNSHSCSEYVYGELRLYKPQECAARLKDEDIQRDLSL